MAGDYTRITFEPRKDHAGVLMQQGRVTLDADWNEYVELLDRRLRAETIDIIGRCVVPKETPDGFLIQLSGGSLTIGPGRAYVHGLLAENHGGDPLEFDPVLEEQRGTQPVAYEDQPYFPNAKTAAPLPTAGTHIAYLDVWQREVTHLEDPDLIEKAIDVDTATRLQTAWQMRLLRARAGTTCDSQLPAWDDLTAPSAGRLSTAPVGVPVPTDPCTIPPSGGYRGTENRLYRIEIHDPGPLGTATFKWSRDNASVAARVTGVDAARTELTLVRLGRDTVQRIRVGDWVEVTDDWREFDRLPGEMFKVVDADDVERTITLDSALPAAFDPTDPARHTRVRRWDQSGAAVDAAGTPIVLEDGVEIRFGADPTGGDFHVGDYWVCAARTADASIEILVDEPPLGVHHHYCRLAVVTFPGSETDCRTLWPPDFGGDQGCDCTVCVTPESHATGELTIQHAVDLVRATGGKICLQAGFYRVDRAVRIVGAQSIEIAGRGWRTIVLSPGREPAFLVERSLGVTIRDLTVVTTTLARKGAVPRGIAILLRTTIGTLVERCVCAQIGAVRAPTRAARAGSREDTVEDLSRAFIGPGPRGAGAPVIALDGLIIKSRLRDNVLIGSTGIGPIWADLSTPEVARRAMGPALDTAFRTTSAEAVARGSGYALTFDLVIDDNFFLCWLNGVALEGFSLHLGEMRVADNTLLGCLRVGIASTGYTSGGRVDVLHNLVRVKGYGIAVGVDDARVADNDVGSLRLFGSAGKLGTALTVVETGGSRGAGILLAPGLGPRGIDRCIVSRNRIFGVGRAGIEIVTDIASALVSGNVIQGTGAGGVEMAERTSADTLTVADNQILDVALREGERGDIHAGVLLYRTLHAAVVGNTIHRVALRADRAQISAGIAMGWCEHVRAADNEVVGVGPVGEFVGAGAGMVFDSFRSADVNDNVVRRSEEVPRDPGRSAWYGIVATSALDVEFDVRPVEPVGRAERGNEELVGTSDGPALVGTSDGPVTSTTRVAAEAGAAATIGPLLGGVREAMLGDERLGVSAGARFVLLSRRGRDTAAVHGNLVEAYGGVSAVVVRTDGSCLFNDNRSYLATRPKSRERPPVAELTAAALVVGDNYFEGGLRFPALVLDAGRYTVLGNITSGPILVDAGANPLGSPWKQLNV